MNPSERNAPYAAWRELVKAADGFYAERPWEILTEETIFGVLDPESGQTLYCTILGQLGEVFGMAVYPGPDGWRSHLKTEDPEYKGVEPRFYLCSLLARKMSQCHPSTGPCTRTASSFWREQENARASR
jgi:hypothetical protein